MYRVQENANSLSTFLTDCIFDPAWSVLGHGIRCESRDTWSSELQVQPRMFPWNFSRQDSFCVHHKEGCRPEPEHALDFLMTSEKPVRQPSYTKLVSIRK